MLCPCALVIVVLWGKWDRSNLRAVVNTLSSLLVYIRNTFATVFLSVKSDYLIREEESEQGPMSEVTTKQMIWGYTGTLPPRVIKCFTFISTSDTGVSKTFFFSVNRFASLRLNGRRTVKSKCRNRNFDTYGPVCGSVSSCVGDLATCSTVALLPFQSSRPVSVQDQLSPS